MKIIIAGAGDVGFHLAELLASEKQDIILIDTNQEVLDYASSRLDVLTINGDSASIEVLNQANVQRASMVLAVTTSEKINLITAILSKKMGAKQTIARINNPEYLDEENQEMFLDLGVDHMISPTSLASEEIFRLLSQSSFTDIFDFEEGRISLVGINIQETCSLINLPLSQMPAEALAIKLRPAIILRGHKTIIPRGEDIIRKGDLVYFIALKENIPALKTLINVRDHVVKNVMILGGGELGLSVAKLLETKYNVTLIERDRNFCKKLSLSLRDSLIINGEYSNFDLMMDEGLQRMDAFIALTDNSETNIIASLTARNYGVFKTIARVENKEYTYVSQNIGVDSLINKKLFAANEIFRFIRKGKVEALTSLSGVDAEVIEYLVHKTNKLTRKPLKELHLPKGSLVGAVIRGDDVYIPDGDFQIDLGDKVIVLALPEDLGKLEQLFK
jgi:trk system potassium uptake protein